MSSITREDAERACAEFAIPDHMWEAVFEYVAHRREAGGFFMAVVNNDFVRACCAADTANQEALFGWAQLLYNFFPPNSYGSPEKVDAWLKGGSDAQ